MRKRNNKQITTLAILLVAVVGLSIGFAAFSNILTISSGATVTPNASTFNVDFSSSATSVVTNNITPTLSGATGTAATIDNTTDPTIENLNATFTAPGQSVTYTFYAYNAGEYEAFLTNINYLNVEGEELNKVCTPAAGTTAALVTAACDDISVTVKADTITATGTQTVSGKSLAKGASHKIEVTIAYAENGDRADGDFTVAFGDISLTYKTVDQSANLITFNIFFEDGSPSITFQAEEGMTWGEFIESDYNTDNIFTLSETDYEADGIPDYIVCYNNNYIYYGFETDYHTVEPLSVDLIVAGGEYGIPL